MTESCTMPSSTGGAGDDTMYGGDGYDKYFYGVCTVHSLPMYTLSLPSLQQSVWSTSTSCAPGLPWLLARDHTPSLRAAPCHLPQVVQGMTFCMEEMGMTYILMVCAQHTACPCTLCHCLPCNNPFGPHPQAAPQACLGSLLESTPLH